MPEETHRSYYYFSTNNTTTTLNGKVQPAKHLSYSGGN